MGRLKQVGIATGAMNLLMFIAIQTGKIKEDLYLLRESH